MRLTDVAPIGGRLVLFKSNARVPHEVLESRAPRYAVTLWYFHGEEVREARRRDAATEEQRAAQEAKIAREIATMSLKYGGESEVRVRRSGRDEWRDVEESPSASAASEFGVRRAAGSNASTPKSAASNASSPFPPFVPPPCESTWDGVGRDRALVVRVPLPAGTKAGSCAAETEAGSRLVLSAPGVPDGTVVVHLPEGADANDVEVRLVKRPERALTVRVACPAARADLGESEAGLGEPEADPEAEADAESAPTRAASLDASPRAGEACVGVGGTLSWSADTEFTPLPPPLPRRPGAAPRGVDLRDAVDWEDFTQVRWSLAGIEDARPVLTPHALDALSFPVTLAWALQLETTRDALRAARVAAETAGRARVLAAVAAAAGRSRGRTSATGTPPRFRRRSSSPAPPRRRSSSSQSTRRIGARRSSPRRNRAEACISRSSVPTLATRRFDDSPRRSPRRRDARRRGRTARLPDEASVVFIGFNTGMGGGGGELARGWAADLVRALSRPNTPAAFTAANDYADLRGELAAFQARWVRGSRSNRARIRFERTRTPSGRGTVPRGFASGRVTRRRGGSDGAARTRSGTSCGASRTDEVPPRGSRTHSCARWRRGRRNARAGAAWDALGMRR